MTTLIPDLAIDYLDCLIPDEDGYNKFPDLDKMILPEFVIFTEGRKCLIEDKEYPIYKTATIRFPKILIRQTSDEAWVWLDQLGKLITEGDLFEADFTASSCTMTITSIQNEGFTEDLETL